MSGRWQPISSLVKKKSVADVYLNWDGWLVVCGCWEDLWLLRRNDGVAADELGHHSADSLNAHRQRVYIEKHQVSGVFLATQHACLHCSTVRHCLVRVDSTAWLLDTTVKLSTSTTMRQHFLGDLATFSIVCLSTNNACKDPLGYSTPDFGRTLCWNW